MVTQHEMNEDDKRLMQYDNIEYDAERGKLIVPIGTKCKCRSCLNEWTRHRLGILSPNSLIRCGKCKGARIDVAPPAHSDRFIDLRDYLSKKKEDTKTMTAAPDPEARVVENNEAENGDDDASIQKKLEKAETEGVESIPMEVSFEGETYNLEETDEPIPIMTKEDIEEHIKAEPPAVQEKLQPTAAPKFDSPEDLGLQPQEGKTIDGKPVMKFDNKAIGMSASTITGLETYLLSHLAGEEVPEDIKKELAHSWAMTLYMFKDYIEASLYIQLIIVAAAHMKGILWAMKARKARIKREKEGKVRT